MISPTSYGAGYYGSQFNPNSFFNDGPSYPSYPTYPSYPSYGYGGGYQYSPPKQQSQDNGLSMLLLFSLLKDAFKPKPKRRCHNHYHQGCQPAYPPNNATPTTPYHPTEADISPLGTDVPLAHANQNVTGNGQKLRVQDVKGANNNSVSGSDNRVDFFADKGANTFTLGGNNNRVGVYNLGADDTVRLTGAQADWREVTTGSSTGHYHQRNFVLLRNDKTGTIVKLASDRNNRGADFIRQRIQYNC